MPYQIVRHTVADYAKWKTVFDEHGAARTSRGSKGAQVLRGALLIRVKLILYGVVQFSMTSTSRMPPLVGKLRGDDTVKLRSWY